MSWIAAGGDSLVLKMDYNPIATEISKRHLCYIPMSIAFATLDCLKNKLFYDLYTEKDKHS